MFKTRYSSRNVPYKRPGNNIGLNVLCLRTNLRTTAYRALTRLNVFRRNRIKRTGNRVQILSLIILVCANMAYVIILCFEKWEKVTTNHTCLVIWLRLSGIDSLLWKLYHSFYFFKSLFFAFCNFDFIRLDPKIRNLILNSKNSNNIIFVVSNYFTRPTYEIYIHTSLAAAYT